ncbi:MAG: PAS domain-containing protein, partial [Acidobacteriota bacterium]
MHYNSRPFRLLTAVLAAGFALLLRRVADPVAGPSTFWLCAILGVVFSAWHGGLKPGLVTSALLLLAGLWFEAPSLPAGSEAQPPAAAFPAFSAFLFSCAALAVCAAMQRLRTEHFKAQATTARLHDVLESTPDAILSLDGEFRCLYANARAGQIAKRQPALLCGKSLRTVFPETPSVIVYKELQRALREGLPVHFEDRAGTSRRWYEFEAYPVPAGLNLFVRDITARKVTEARRFSVTSSLELEHVKLESVLRELPVGVIITSADMHV